MPDCRKSILFLSTMEGYSWGGSEELWSRAALDLTQQGILVYASVAEWKPVHPRVAALSNGGVRITLRPRGAYAFNRNPLKRLFSRGRAPLLAEAERLIKSRSPAMVVISDGAALAPVDLLELCAEKQVPFVTIGQANSEHFWPGDAIAARFRAVLPAARRCYFVSEANLRLTENQIGDAIPNAEVIRNPMNVARDASPRWPSLVDGHGFRLACVARLHPPSKGQDILLEALASSDWPDREWRLFLYGEGPMRQTLERLAQRLGIDNRVVFAGFAPVESIWAKNHVLVMPSRYEGLPLALVEAMLCSRPVIATDVAGHREIVEDGVTGFLADSPTVSSLRGALDRFWARRHEAEAIGRAGMQRICTLVPADPVREFSEKLKAHLGCSDESCSKPVSEHSRP